MSTRPLVSVIMPVYNVERYVASAIGSVLAQSMGDLELVLVDDGSEDASLKICRGVSDARVLVVAQENRGLAGARNTGIRHSSGDYVALLDSDDLWAPTKLERHVEHLESAPRVGISYSYSRFIDESGRPLGLYQKPKLHDVRVSDIFLRDPINASAPVIRRRVLEDIRFTDTRRGVAEDAFFDEDFRRCEDLECWMRIALTTDWRFEGIPEPLTRLRSNPAGLSADLDKMSESWEQCIDKIAGYAPEFVARWGSLARAFQLRYQARRAVRNGQGRVAVRLALAAIRQDHRAVTREPGITLITLAAALCLAVLPAGTYRRLEATAMSVGGFFQRRGMRGGGS
ncbi:MAG: glycosyltransferase family 2 protein [Thermoleophilia bacterium]